MIGIQGWDDARFVERCRVAAARRGWTLPELCRRAGLAHDLLKHPLTDGGGRNISTVIKLANAADVSVAWLLGLEQSREQLARIGLVANLTAHLFCALHPDSHTREIDTSLVDLDELMLTVMDALKRPQKKAPSGPPDQQSPGSETSTAAPAAPHRGRTSRTRSTAL